MIYEDFHLRLAADGEERFQVHARFREQRASTSFALPPELRICGTVPGKTSAGATRHLAIPDSSHPAASSEEIGRRLFQTLFDGEVGRLFLAVHGACEEHRERALRLRLHFPHEKRTWRLQNLPWELLYHPEDRRFLALDPRLPVVRSMDTPHPLRVLPPTPPLRVLIAMANPPDTPPLALTAERKKIEERLSGIDQLAPTVLERTTRRELRRYLRSGHFHIVHFMGHGVGFDPDKGEGALLLESPEDWALPLSATGFAEFFQGIEAPLLVVLNACETAASAEGVDPVRSVAASLVIAGLPAVLAQRAPIQDDAALILAEELYLQLAQGSPIEAAVAEARLALRSERESTTAWAIPSLFLRPLPAEALPVPESVEIKPPDIAPPGAREPAPVSAPRFVQNIRAGQVGTQTTIQGEIVHYHEESRRGK